MRLLSRESWSARVAQKGMVGHQLERLTVHHTAMGANLDPVDALRRIQVYHQGERGWADIAYHVLIDAEGKAWAGRYFGFAGDSATDYDLTGHLEVALIGNFEDEPPPRDQLVRAGEWVHCLAEIYDLRTIGAHCDYAETACPGQYLIPAVREWAAGIAKVPSDDLL